MKKCPSCNRTYSDETITFCLADGALLSAPYDPQATLHLPVGRPALPSTEMSPQAIPESLAPTKQATEDPDPRPTIASPAPPLLKPPQTPTPTTNQQGNPNRSAWIIVGSGIIIVVVVLLVLYIQPFSTNSNQNSNSQPTNTTVNRNANAVQSNAPITANSNISRTSLPSVSGLEGTVWAVTITREGLEPSGGTLEILSRGKAKMTYKPQGKSQAGSWTLQGDQISIHFPENYQYAEKTLSLTIKGDEMTGVYTWYGGYKDHYVLRKVN